MAPKFWWDLGQFKVFCGLEGGSLCCFHGCCKDVGLGLPAVIIPTCRENLSGNKTTSQGKRSWRWSKDILWTPGSNHVWSQACLWTSQCLLCARILSLTIASVLINTVMLPGGRASLRSSSHLLSTPVTYMIDVRLVDLQPVGQDPSGQWLLP